MRSVFRTGVDSAKVSFPSMPQGAHLSTEETEQIENAIAQMELWNTLSYIPFPEKNLAPVERTKAKSDPVPGELGREVINADAGTVVARSSSCERKGELESVPIEDRVDGTARDGNLGHFPVALPPQENMRLRQEERRLNEEEYSCFQHVRFQGMNPYYHLRKPFAVFMDAPAPLRSSVTRVPVRQPLRQVNVGDIPYKRGSPRPQLRITPEKENVPPLRFKIRRKPVPRFFEVPLTPNPEEAKGVEQQPDLPRKQIIDNFPTMGSGGCGRRYLVDPEELWQAPKEIHIRNLTLKKLLGAGAQGKVYLAQGPPEGEKRRVFAIKVMVKNLYVQYDTIAQEQKLLKRLRDHRFLLRLEGSFHDRKNFYLITQYHPGRDLHDLLRKRGCLDTSSTCFYAAELSSALVFLHQNHILHRDIKLSNILIQGDGHLCLGDFGLSVDFMDRAVDEDEDSFMADAEPVVRGFVGTTAYMAPEILNDEYYSYKVDWWSLGVTLYNLLEGQFPWPSLDREWLAAHAGIGPLRFKTTTHPDAKSFVRALLQRDSDQRIGDLDVFNHLFFNGINVQEIDQGKLKPPYVPQPVDYDNIPNALTRRDHVDIGVNYPAGETPVASYFFFGSSLPEHEGSTISTGTEQEGTRPPLNCSQSLYELLQESEIDSENATLRNSETVPESPSPARLSYVSLVGNLSEVTIIERPMSEGPIHAGGVSVSVTVPGTEECTRVNADVQTVAVSPPPAFVRAEVTRTDSKFRWSLLSIHKRRFDGAVVPQVASTPVKEHEDLWLGQCPSILSPGVHRDALEPVYKPDNGNEGIVMPTISGVSVLVTPPREDHARQETMNVADNETTNAFLSPNVGKSSSTFETVAFSFGIEGNDETGATTLEFGSPSPGFSLGSASGPGLISASPLGLDPCRSSDSNSPAGLDMDKPLPPLPLDDGSFFSALLFPVPVSAVGSSNGHCSRKRYEVAKWLKRVHKSFVEDVKKARCVLWKVIRV